MKYNVGTVTATNGSQTITGAGTKWLSNVPAGSLFTVINSGITYVVGSVTSDTQLLLTSAYAGTTVSAQTYTIIKSFTPNLSLPYPDVGDVAIGTIVKGALTAIDTNLGSSGVTAGTYKSVTVNTRGQVTSGANPTTLSGYGIADGVSLTGTQTLSGKSFSGAVGFGTTGPLALVHISSPTDSAALLALSAGIGTQFIVNTGFLGADLLRIYNSTNPSSGLVMNALGRLSVGGEVTEERFSVAGNIVGTTANTTYVGTARLPMAGGYFQTAPVITSGQEFKVNARDFTSDEKTAAVVLVQKCPRLFHLKSSVEEKGADKARFHAGALYEEAYAVLQAAGFADAEIERFSLFCASPVEKPVTTTRSVTRQKTVSKTRTVEVIATAVDGTQTVTYTEEQYDDPVWLTDASGADIWYDLADANGAALKSPDGTPRKYRKPVYETVDEQVTETVVDPDATPIRGIRYTELDTWYIVGLRELNADRAAEIAALSARVAALEKKS